MTRFAAATPLLECSVEALWNGRHLGGARYTPLKPIDSEEAVSPDPRWCGSTFAQASAFCCIGCAVLVLGAGAALVSMGDADEVETGWTRLLAVSLIFIAAIVGVWLPWKMKTSQRLVACGNALSGGVMLSAGVIHLLSDAAREYDSGKLCPGKTTPTPEPGFPTAYFLCTVGFVATLICEELGHMGRTTRKDFDLGTGNERETNAGHPHRSDSERRSNGDDVSYGSSTVGVVLTLALSLHSLMEGLALGLVQGADEITSILVAILAHKSLAAFALGTRYVQSVVNLCSSQVEI